ncbi:MAG: phospho-N-acetylmuramoyl-pentapeptide-transferase, partial [Polaribacter sp.]|nr:phospho-N-acetylmuramoyl-pentapeptide-transferase [Polaribacter sp.]
MLYYLFEYLESQFSFPGASVFQFITFRAAAAFILSLLISAIFGKRIIKFLQKQQVGETVRDLGLEGQKQKSGTPTMGGIIIILATLIPVILLTKLDNIYIVILIITTFWMGFIGFLDDYIKVFKKDKDGLKGKFKILGQVGLGLIVGSMLYFNDGVTIKEQLPVQQQVMQENGRKKVFGEAHKSTKTTVPFLKDNELDYSKALRFLGEGYEKYGWIVFIFITVFIVTGVSNGANLT